MNLLDLRFQGCLRAEPLGYLFLGDIVDNTCAHTGTNGSLSTANSELVALLHNLNYFVSS